MGVSCGYSPLIYLRVCASRGVKLYVESGACRILLILIFCLGLILSQCLPLFDEICRGSINFIRSYLSNESSLVRHISQYAVSIVEPCRVLVRMEAIILYASL